MKILKSFFLGFLLFVAFSFTAYSQTASVISANANLRGTPTNKGKVINSLPRGYTVEVIKQKGQWFLVQSLDYVGWIHGNAIRLEEQSTSEDMTEGGRYVLVPVNPTKTGTNSSTQEEKVKSYPRIGMTAWEVRDSSWGEPDEINRTTTASGVQEQWIYKRTEYLTGVTKWKTLYFNNGRLSSISE